MFTLNVLCTCLTFLTDRVLQLLHVNSNPHQKTTKKNLILSLNYFQTVKLNLTSKSLEDAAFRVPREKKAKGN